MTRSMIGFNEVVDFAGCARAKKTRWHGKEKANERGAAHSRHMLAKFYLPSPAEICTKLIPTKGISVLKFETTTPLISPASSRPIIPLKKLGVNKSSKRRSSFIVLGVGVFIALSFLVVAIGLTLSVQKQWYPRNFQPLSARSSKLSGFSPDFLDGMSKLKHSLLNFSLEELRLATANFSEDSLVGGSVYQSTVGESHFAIEEMGSEVEVHQVIDILTKINHLNIAKLQGFCFGIIPYLIFKFAELGNVKGILSNAKLATELTWAKRMQIAFDLAVGLHYIHYCTSPSYVNRNINSKNVLITMDWRAKISGFKLAKPFTCTEEEVEKNSWYESVIVGRNGYLAPEYLYHGLGSPKVDIHAFGVVLLELMSAKEAVMEGCMLKECVRFPADGGIKGSSCCLEKLKGLIDPSLDRDYPWGDALCLALLAKGCVKEDPQHRPNMNNVLKALSRIV
ncbi:hypothetical protein GIB67_032292 [Kingdonia uniflora]|uniref:Protein kinase domain-containing protein n=1 Tax=Kingdonia uniflora TaxID=39325 RepID=A0A7J7MX45_9MAGN|nr:hypothetical protein GIB67_032292 [Kingdonia uniflora]